MSSRLNVTTKKCGSSIKSEIIISIDEDNPELNYKATEAMSELAIYVTKLSQLDSQRGIEHLNELRRYLS